MRRSIRMSVVLTTLWVVATSGFLFTEYLRLDSHRDLPYGAKPPPSGFVIDPTMRSAWFLWKEPPNPEKSYQPELRPRLSRIIALFAFPPVFLWLAATGAVWVAQGHGSASTKD